MNITDLITTLPWHPSRKWSKRPLSKINKIVLHQELADGTIEAVNNYHINPNHISDRVVHISVIILELEKMVK